MTQAHTGLSRRALRDRAALLALAAVLAIPTLSCHQTVSSTSTTTGTEAKMKVWFEGEAEITCTIEEVARAHEDLGAFYVAVVRRMPGLSTVELVEQSEGLVVIRTNEGLMTRSNIRTRVEGESVVVEFDELYEAGSMVTTRSHYRDAYTVRDGGVLNELVISGVEAPGLMGFLYRSFGNKSIGEAVLAANKGHFEEPGG